MKLHIFRRQSPVKVLGPYERAVIWVQGCSWKCPGCIVPESWSPQGGDIINVEELAQWILTQPEIEGITLSGGEPMQQAEALTQMIKIIKSVKDLGVVCYTGYRLETLQQKGTTGQHNLLQQIDLLIDGLYLEAQQGNYLWRGSSNQRLLALSNRYLDILTKYLTQGDASAGLEFYTDTTGELYFTGVPHQPNFRENFEARMRDRGIILKA